MSFVFTDTRGRKWDITLNLAAARRIDASDFSSLTDKKFSILKPTKDVFQQILTEPSLMFAIIWAVIQPQVKKLHKAYVRLATTQPIGSQGIDTTVSDSPGLAADFADYDTLPKEIQATSFPFNPETHYEDAELEFVSSINGPAKEEALERFWESLSDFFPEQKNALSMLMRRYKGARESLNKKMAEAESDLEISLENDINYGVEKMRAELRKTPEQREAERKTLAEMPGQTSTT